MTFLQIIARLVAGTLANETVRDIFTTVGKYAIRQGSAALIRHIRRGTSPRKGVQTIR